MLIKVQGTLTRFATKKAERDREGNEVKGPGIILTLEFPIDDLQPSEIAGLVRAQDREMELLMNDLQAAFAMKTGADGSPLLAPV